MQQRVTHFMENTHVSAARKRMTRKHGKGESMAKKVLVTGAAGYIGQAAVKSLLDRGAQVTAVDVRQENIDPRAEFRHLDLFQDDPEVFQHLGCPDVCLHMAWRNGFVHNAPSHMEDVSAHVRFLRQMMEGGLKQLAVMGTMHEVGYHEGAITEDTPCNPQSMYGIAKNALRQTCELLAAQHGAQLQWLRAYYIIGNDEKSNSIFAKILQAAQEGKTTFPLNSGKNRYDFIDLAELGEQLAACVMQTEVLGIINCCTGQPVSLGERVEQFIRDHGLSLVPEYGAFPDRPYDSPGVWGDPGKIQQIMRREA